MKLMSSAVLTGLLTSALVGCQFLAQNNYLALEIEVGVFLAVAGILGLCFGALPTVWPPSRTIFLFTCLLIVSAYSGIFSWIFLKKVAPVLIAAAHGFIDLFDMEVSGRTFTLLWAGPLVILVFIGCSPLAILLHKLKENGTSLLNTVVGTALLALIVLPNTLGQTYWISGKLSPERKNLPPFVIIVLDMQTGLRGLPLKISGGAAAKSAVEETFREFRLYSHAYSRYAVTPLSLSAAFNFVDFGQVPPIQRHIGKWYTFAVPYLLADNRVGYHHPAGYDIEN